MSYDLRRLRLHGLIERLPGTHRYTVTDHGFKIAIFLTRAHQRLVRPGLAEALDDHSPPTPLRRRFDQLDTAIDAYRLAAQPDRLELDPADQIRLLKSSTPVPGLRPEQVAPSGQHNVTDPHSADRRAPEPMASQWPRPMVSDRDEVSAATTVGT